VPGVDSVSARAPAKTNLVLLAGPLRADGYHEISTVYLALDVYDTLTLTPAEAGTGITVSVTGRDADAVPLDQSNVAHRAVRAVAERVGTTPDVSIRIDKQIPVAGGMAGGSADAAAGLVAANALWDAGLGDDALQDLAAGLGSDVPFSLLGGLALGTGRGEQLHPLDSGQTWNLAVVPGDGGLATPAVFQQLDHLRPHTGFADRHWSDDEVEAIVAAVVSGEPSRLEAAIENDLQAAAITLQPSLRARLLALQAAGARTAWVSGSGPTCVGLCPVGTDPAEVVHHLAESGYGRAFTTTGPAPGAHVVSPRSRPPSRR